MNPAATRCNSKSPHSAREPSARQAFRLAQSRPRRWTSAATCQPNASVSRVVATTVRTSRRDSRRRFPRARRGRRGTAGDGRPAAGPPWPFNSAASRATSCAVDELRRRLRLRVAPVLPRRVRLAAGHLDLLPGRVGHAPAGALGPRLIAAAVEHHGGDGRRPGVAPRQPMLAVLLHLGVAGVPPLAADPLAEPLEVARADRQLGQGLQVVAGLAERGGAGRLPHRLAEHAGAIALGAQAELVVQREKKPPDMWGSTTARAAT